MLDALLTSTAAAETITMSGTVTIILASLALGLFISLIYRFTERERGASASFAVTLIMLPSIICLLYTYDAADAMQCVEHGCRRIIKKNNT